MSTQGISPAKLEELVEVFDFRPKLVEGQAAGSPYAFMRGIVQLADVENKNKRVYPRTVWEKVLGESSDFMRRLANNQVVGQLGHPDNGKTAPRDVSHVMTRVWMEEGFLPECVICAANGPAHSHIMGEEKILPTPDGNVLRVLVEAGIPIGMSSRGKGSVRGGAGNQQIVAEDFALDTFDFVFDPSTPGAWGRVVTEGVLQACAGNICCTTTEAELAGYRRILAEACERGDTAVRSEAKGLIEAIDTRLATGAPSAAMEAVTAATERLLEASKERRPFGGTAKTIQPGGGDPDARGRMTEEMGMEISLANPAVKAFVESETARLRSEQARALSEADEVRAKLTEATADLAASKAALSEALIQRRNAEFQLKALRESSLGTDSGPAMYDAEYTESQALEAAKQVIDELADENDVLREENLGLAARTEAAESFVERVRLRESRKAVADHTEKVLAKANLGEAVAAEARTFLTEATTIEDVNRRFRMLDRVRSTGTAAPAPKQSLREGALPGGATSLTEDHEALLARAQGKTSSVQGSDAPIDTSHLTESERDNVDRTELLMGRLTTGKVQPLARRAAS